MKHWVSHTLELEDRLSGLELQLAKLKREKMARALQFRREEMDTLRGRRED